MKKIAKRLLYPFEKYLFIELLWLSGKYFKKARHLDTYPKLGNIFKQSLYLVNNKLKIVRKDLSYASEYENIQKILKKIPNDLNFLVDIGASDGITQSSTVKFILDNNFKGVLFELSPENFAKLAFVYSDRDSINLVRAKVTPTNVVGLFGSLQIPRDFTLLNLDIDSYDLDVANALLNGGFRPKVISMEINEVFPPNIEFEVKYFEDHMYQGDKFYGCSAASAHKALAKHGYSLIEIHGNNGFFVHNSYASGFATRGLFELWTQGYRNLSNRKQLFPWNEPFNFLLTDANSMCEFKIRSMFKAYEGKYHLEVADTAI